MEDLYDIEGLVKLTLTDKPDTRSSDTLLYLCICKMVNPNVATMSFERVILETNHLGLPNYASVSRARRKIQADNKELRADKRTINRRYIRWKVFRDYATDK